MGGPLQKIQKIIYYRKLFIIENPGSSRLYRLGVSQAQEAEMSGDERPRLRASQRLPPTFLFLFLWRGKQVDKAIHCFNTILTFLKQYHLRDDEHHIEGWNASWHAQRRKADVSKNDPRVDKQSRTSSILSYLRSIPDRSSCRHAQRILFKPHTYAPPYRLDRESTFMSRLPTIT